MENRALDCHEAYRTAKITRPIGKNVRKFSYPDPTQYHDVPLTGVHSCPPQAQLAINFFILFYDRVLLYG